ncbi:MAG: hypothetical protein A2Y07_06460 [Planctomycetes bacterium GWF2_50_10]|nr:MAG: hypothetical protein A2Y07_06460 [Planctomycetes bacterium GWF2_50_10]
MKKPLALQLYSARQLAHADLPGLLEKVAQIGFSGVEFAGFYDNDPADISTLINRLGLKVVGNHVPLPSPQDMGSVATQARAIGCDTLIVGLGPDDYSTPEAMNESINKFRSAVAAASAYGINLAMHNHWWEFELLCQNQPVYDYIMLHVPQMLAELDIYWAFKAGSDPRQVLSKWGHRSPLLHVKDGDLDSRNVHKAVGSGKLPMKDILNGIDFDQVQWLIVELDNCDTDIIEAVRSSYDWLVSNGFGLTLKI